MPLKNIPNTGQDVLFALKRIAVGPYRVRRAQLYGVGIGKSGTHSLANMFSKNVRARHEPEAEELIEKILDWRSGRLSENEMAAWLRARDRRLAIEVDSSGPNFQMVDLLLREFPRARFVLTIRDCYSWLNSMMNEVLRSPNAPAPWFRLRKFYYERVPVVHAPEEQGLKAQGLYSLDAYFSHWAMRNGQAIAKIPADRLFIVRTDQLRERAYELADFAGLPHRSVRPHRTHEYKNPGKRPILREIDRAFLEQKVEQHCRPLMTRFFPEIKSLDDAKL